MIIKQGMFFECILCSVLNSASLSVTHRLDIDVAAVALHEVDTDAAIDAVNVGLRVVDMDGLAVKAVQLEELDVGRLSEED